MSTGKYTAAEIAAMLKKPKGRVRNVAPLAQRTYKGVVYHSKAECVYAFQLDALVASGEVFEWQRQVGFPLMVNGKLIARFVVDFHVNPTEGEPYLVEVKGWETPEYKLKLKLFKALYPNADYRVVKA